MIWFILLHRQISANMIWELVQWVLTDENVTEHRKLSTDVSYFAAEEDITRTWKPLWKDAAVNSTGAVMLSAKSAAELKKFTLASRIEIPNNLKHF